MDYPEKSPKTVYERNTHIYRQPLLWWMTKRNQASKRSCCGWLVPMSSCCHWKMPHGKK
ncbi:hypothetical protein LSH36_110g05078 [Paralvinella palmiformis]|uniref:Uncharacterized protein n=1 Tax=Paralvinella palmiformis TaxID=53620 RepID=A0AAD9K0E2_9ANNE|nr:hypothetical protein LSH36_110g05078 [Paralvinella palmiformis]